MRSPIESSRRRFGLFLSSTAILLACASSAAAQVCGEKLAPPAEFEHQRFGWSIDVDGDLMAACGLQANCETGLARVFRWNGSAWLHEADLTSTSVVPGSAFGRSIAVLGDRIFIGAPGASVAGSSAGAVIVFGYDATSGTWSEDQILVAADAESEDFFGLSVAISADRLVISAPGDNDLGLDSGSVYVFRDFGPGMGWIQEQKLLASDGINGDAFGEAVALGERIVVGAPDRNETGPSSGAAYIFDWNPTAQAWVQEQKLIPPTTGGKFGSSVAVEGDLIACGAPSAIGRGVSGGLAYLFRFDPSGATWNLEETAVPSTFTRTHQFGSAVTLAPDRLFVGAPHAIALPGPAAGAVFVFDRDPSSGDWSESAILSDPSAQAGDRIGSCVAVSGSHLIAGAPQTTSDGAGAVVTYEEASGAWSFTQRFSGIDGGVDDLFGHDVALDGDRMAIGVLYDDAGAWRAGAVAIAELDPSTEEWSIVQELRAGVAYAEQGFGYSVGLSGDWLVVGAPYDPEFAEDAGAAYVFRRLLGAWVEQQKLVPAGIASDDLVGLSVAISGEVILLGAPGRDPGGAVYVFRLDPSGSIWVPEMTIQPSTLSANDAFGSSLDLDGAAAVVGAPGNDDLAITSGLAMVYRNLSPAVWTPEGTLYASDPSNFSRFGSSVSVSDEWILVGAFGAGTSGQAYCFEHTSGTWTETQILTGSTADPDSRFGVDVTLLGDRGLVGSPRTVCAGGDCITGPGSAFLFELGPSSTWTEIAEFTASDGSVNDRFGNGVALGADLAVVASPGDDDGCDVPCGGCDSGAVHLYSLTPCLLVTFRRGDANSDGGIDIGDPVFALEHLFSGGVAPCADAMDSNDDGALDIGDPIHTLQFLFSGGPALPSPSPTCGPDPSPDGLDCASTACP